MGWLFGAACCVLCFIMGHRQGWYDAIEEIDDGF